VKRLFFTSVIISFILIFGHAQESHDFAYIVTKGKEISSFSITNYSRVTYDKENIVFDFADGQLSYPLTDYISVTFVPFTTSVKESDRMEFGGVEIRLDRDVLFFLNVRKMSDLKIYSLNGIQLYNRKISYESESIPLSQFHERILIIQVADKRFKVRH
jgi:hypothetical protein